MNKTVKLTSLTITGLTYECDVRVDNQELAAVGAGMQEDEGIAWATQVIDVIQRGLHWVKVRHAPPCSWSALVSGSHVHAVVQLSEALLPWVGVITLFRRHKLKAALARVEQRHVVLVHIVVQSFPKQKLIK